MRRTTYTLLALVVALAMTACGSKKSGSGGSAGYTDGGVPPVTDPTDPIWTTGAATATLVPTSAFPDFLGWTPNRPSEFKVSVKLQKFGTYTRSGGGYDQGFGGVVSISFKDGGVVNTYDFSSLVNSAGVVRSNSENHKYNLLTTDYPELAGRIGYHGFFEDVAARSNTTFPVFGGAVILVLDATNDLGDGQGPSIASGSVWFKNYFGYAPVSPTNCWFIYGGWPYDCRAWKSGDGVATKRSIYPDSGYVKLGSFTNLDMKKAFSVDNFN